MTIAAKDALLIDVRDNGVGLAEAAAPGVGIRSMEERASELGGSVAFSVAPSGGAHVSVRLPLQ